MLMTVKKMFVPKRQLSNGLLQALLATSSDGIAIIGIDGDFLEANATFGCLFAVDPEQVVGMKCMEVLGCGKADKLACDGEGCRVQKALQQEQPLPPVEIDLTLQQTLRTVCLTMTPVRTKNRRVCLMIARDVTALRDVI